ncbi:cholesterol transporter ABCA5 isoform X1 [Spodoptera frugiperda]|uniref:Cholesterol transporter ABCA5 isoform X1 n=3 Tax=Spodoptera frugiperda TaxID=7108 RepID=A0A9R0DTA2_SPOFR|nr:cholesterol transporter ABCA5 isoform X2 [Spodoptera frugiperda]XP_050552858.1 cholesterol transporter ABCA5 isoform X1 [Spodoptera frugiperda]
MSGAHGVADVRDDGRDSPASTEQLTKCGEKEADLDCVAIGSRLRGAMGTRRPAKFWPQLWATVVRNLLLKKRDTRKTLAEVLVPLYSLGVLIFLKMLVPNPNFPEVRKPGRLLRIHHDAFPENHSVAVVADWLNANGTMGFLEEINTLLAESHQHPIRWIKYSNNSELNDAYHNDARNFPIAVIFHTDPTSNIEPLRYTIRTNPSHIGTPSTRILTTSPAKCRERTASKDWSSDWSRGGQLIPLSEMHGEDTCPVLQYYYSGFLALQTLIDYIKIKFDTDAAIPPPRIDLRQFPKRQHTGDWLVIFRVIMPMYMVMTLSQFITYLLMFVVGEKEKKIREGMRIMGLKESVYWGSWFLIYAVFVTILSIVSTVLLFTLKVFQHSSYILIFLLMLLFGFTIITFAFMLTPFFDRARTAGILGSFAVNLMSGLYFIQVFVSNADSLAFWFVSLISSSCYALAMDKALVLDMAGVGVTWDNLWSGPGVPFGGSLIMMAVDTVLYGLAAYWLDAVIPSEYGIKQKPWFCLLPSFWLGSRRGRVSAVHFHSNGEAAAHNKDIEPVPRELQDKEAIRIVGLQKSFRHCRKPEIKAIDNIDLSIYEGQITAVLGHNGAGKSTLFNILTGLTAPTNGTAYVYGLDVRDPNDMHEIRQMIGVCPQQDVLFDLLSVKEHLQFFGAVKGIPRKRLPEEIHKALSDVGLLDQMNVFAKHLSGGQKRKLSIAIAFIGDPKIIILDEPTAGVDPVSRRQTWRILQRARHGKVLLLTTHFMDEADILGDRKAVISKGRVRCAGTSLFLKNKFGIGYHLTLVLDGVCREHQITRLVRGHVPRAEKARRHGRELSYILPHYAVHLFPPLFNAIEQEVKEKTNRLGITSYGVSMTTLEEVFLSLEGENAEETEAVEGVSSVKLVRARALSRSLSLQSKTLSYQELNDKDGQKATSLPTPPASHALHSTTHGVEHVKVAPEVPISVDALGETVKTNPTCWRTFCALVYIRMVRMIRDPYKLWVMILMPIISCALGLYMKSRQIVFFRMQPLKLEPNAYFNKTPIAVYSEQGNIKEITDLRDSLESLGAYPIIDFDGNFSSLLDMENFGAFSLRDSVIPYGKIMAYYNSTYTHSLPIIVNLLDNSVYRVLMSASGLIESFKPIEVSTHPFQQTEQQEEFNLGNVVCAIFMGMIFALVPVTLAVDIVYDREIKAKNQLRVNGLSMSMYFLTYFTVLIFIMILTSVGVLVLVILNDIPSLTNGSAITMLSGLLLLYSPSAILFNTCLSYIFDKMDSAQSIMPNITTWVGVIPFILVAVLDTFKWGSEIAFYLHLTFSFLDVMYIPYAIIYYVDRVYLTCNLRDLCTTPPLSSYFTAEVWVLLVAMLLHVPLSGAALLAADRVKSGGRICPRKKSTSESGGDAEQEAGGEAGEDEDVRRERRRVAAILQQPKHSAPPLVVHNLRKEYKVRGTGSGGSCWTQKEETSSRVKSRFVGLARLSLAVEGGEVFGLLGHNGAGKTTTMKIITAEERPTHGSVMLGSQNIDDSQTSAFMMLGYCPQHDALWKNVTIREHIECYAAIRGVSKADTPRIVDAYLNGLQIMEHANKNADECSGGTRRKLSFALAMVGSPRVVLLDEPSTGMDPRSKRFLWDTILASFQGKKGAILTTHSMEEADALCSRVGIMVKGGLRCIGSTQHLKNLYGAGYTLEMKIGNNNQKANMMESESLSPSPLRSNENSPSLGEADEGGSNTGSVCAEAEGEAEAVDASIHTPLVAGTPPPPRLQHHRTESGGGGANSEAVIALVGHIFPAAVLEESFAERLVFSVPQSAVSSLARCFQQIEDAKEKLNIVEYSFSQTTLEQVFLKFAQSENVDSSD